MHAATRTLQVVMALAVIALASAVPGWAVQTVSQSLTLYTNGPTQVRETRPTDLKAGEQTVVLDQLPARLNPDSLWVAGPAGLQVADFTFNNADLSREVLLTHLVGQTVRFKDTVASTEHNNIYRSGKLLAWQPGTQYVVIATDRGQEVIPESALLPELLPASLAVWPRLSLHVTSPKAQTAQVQVGYGLDGLRPQVRYQAVLSPKDDTLHLQGWLSVVNESGQGFGPATVQLLAGQPRQDNNPRPMMYKSARMSMAAAPMAEADMAGGSNASNESFGEYYLITLPQPVTLSAGPGVQTFSWLDEAAIAFKRHYIYDPNPGTIWFGYQQSGESDSLQPMTQVSSMIEFANKVATGKTFGQGLPAGQMRVYQPDSAGTIQLLGDLSVPNLPKDEPVKVTLGQSFDVLARKKQLSFSQNKTTQEAKYEVTLKNRKDKAVTVEVLEHPYGEWKLVNPSIAPKEQWQGHLRFDVPVPAGGEAKLTYTLRTGR